MPRHVKDMEKMIAVVESLDWGSWWRHLHRYQKRLECELETLLCKPREVSKKAQVMLTDSACRYLEMP